MKAIFLDFDGVLFDTVAEAYVIAMCAWGKPVDIKSAKWDRRHYEMFCNFRCKVTCARSYYYLLRALDTEFEDRSKIAAIYNELKHATPLDSVLQFEKQFALERRKLRESSFSDWICLHRPYEFSSMILPDLERSRQSFFIISTKEEDVISQILKYYHVPFEEDQILGRRSFIATRSKAIVIKNVQNIYGVEKYIYIDDSQEHLDMCRRIAGGTFILAGWGYTESGNGSSAQEVVELMKEFLIRKGPK
ncbi:MAG: hypothetical protein WCU74_01205 [Candidatus Omnitrophota bacterium]|jgi:phosphoglycolate phosphatase-like HAD superfamily hydrolase